MRKAVPVGLLLRYSSCVPDTPVFGSLKESENRMLMRCSAVSQQPEPSPGTAPQSVSGRRLSACVRQLAGISVLGLALIGCGKNDSVSQPQTEMSNEAINEATQFIAGSESDAQAIVSSIETAVAHSDTAAFTSLIDEEKLVDRMLAGLDLKPQFRKSFIQGMRDGGGLSHLASEIIRSADSGGEYTFVRMVQKNGEVRPLFRFELADGGGINYHEFVVSVDSAGRPRVVDIYVYLTGDMLSQSIRRIVLPAVASENSGILAKLSGAETAFLNNLETIEQINGLIAAGKHKEAMPLFARLPETLQRDKTILMTRLVCAQNISDMEYSDAIRDLERWFPNDPAQDFRSIDLLAIQGQHDNLIRTVDRLIATIQDPCLNLLKIESMLALNRIDEARAAVAEARRMAPDRIDVFWIEVSVLLKAEDHQGTAALLDEIQERFGMTFNDLNTIPEYATFAASEVGREWMARHSRPSPQSPEAAPPSSVPARPSVPVVPRDIPDAADGGDAGPSENQ